jgi:hypothetical protein
MFTSVTNVTTDKIMVRRAIKNPGEFTIKAGSVFHMLTLDEVLQLKLDLEAVIYEDDQARQGAGA